MRQSDPGRDRLMAEQASSLMWAGRTSRPRSTHHNLRGLASGSRQDWQAALAAFDEHDRALAEGRDMRYINEIGAPARAEDLDALTTTAASYGLGLENWYGVRIATDQQELDPAPPSDPRQLAALLDVEERLGATDPYRQLGQLAHLILRKTNTTTAGG